MIGRVLASVIGIPTSTDRALLQTLCRVGLADGGATKLELGHAREIALEMPRFRRKSREDLQEELEEVLAEVGAEKREVVISRIAETLDEPETREQAFALAAVIVFVDLKKTDAEHAFLNELKAGLRLSDARTQAIMAEIKRELAMIERGDQHAPGT